MVKDRAIIRTTWSLRVHSIWVIDCCIYRQLYAS